MGDLKDGRESRALSLSEEIRGAIVRGEYGPGQRLIEGDICERFGASRMAVRTALQELSVHGLVDFTHNRGARVHKVSVREAIEIMEVRKLLVGLIASRAAEYASDEDRERFGELRVQLRDAYDAEDFGRYRQVTRVFHELLRTTSRQTVASEMLRRLHDRTARYSYTLAMLPNGSRASLPHYEAIIDGVVAQDSQRAGAAASDHLAAMIEALRQWAARFSEEDMETEQAGAVWADELAVGFG